MSKILVTGAAGYIGSVLVPMLMKRGHEVKSLDTGYFISAHLYDADTTYIIDRKDVRDIEASDLQDIDAIIHLAALSNDPMGELDPKLTDDINCQASMDLAELALNCGVRRFIFSSSCSVYGETDYPVSESCPVNPLTAYAESKINTEFYVKDLARKEFCPTFLRNATVYGLAPAFRVDLAINNLTALAYVNGKVQLKSTGTSVRPFIHVNDVSTAFINILEAPEDMVRGEVFNVGANHHNYLIKDVASTVGMAVNRPVEIVQGAQVDKRNYLVNFTKFSRYFPNFVFSNDMVDEIQKMWRAFDQYKLLPDDMSKFTRLDQLKQLMYNGTIDDKLRYKGL